MTTDATDSTTTDALELVAVGLDQIVARLRSLGTHRRVLRRVERARAALTCGDVDAAERLLRDALVLLDRRVTDDGAVTRVSRAASGAR